jgi:peptide deformylase
MVAILNILQCPDPRLRNVAQAVEKFDDELRQIAADMTETMYHDNGVGLAAIQVNIKKRIVIIDTSEERNKPTVFVNPEIIDQRGQEDSQEGCLSVPEFWATVQRAAWVKVKAQDEKGKEFSLELEGLFSHCIQHEIDHLNGKLFIDHLSPLKRDRYLKKLAKIKG